jgi:uncharacterized delta-60 repeat protein
MSVVALIITILFINACGLKIEPTNPAATAGVSIDFNGSNDMATASASDPQGNFLLAGTTYSATTRGDFAVAFLSSDFKLASAFNNTGKTQIDFSGGEDEATAVAFQPDGKIVVVGTTTSLGSSSVAAVRLLRNGAIDPTFANGGRFTLRLGSSGDRASSLLVDADGNIYIGAETKSGGRSVMAIIRLKGTGILDSRFNSNGKLFIDIAGGEAKTNAIAFGPNSSVYLAGVVSQGATASAVVAKVTTSGALVSGYGNQGYALIRLAGSTADEIKSLGVDSDGSVIGVGKTTSSAGYKASVYSLTASGEANGNFFGTGAVALSSGEAGDSIGAGVLVTPTSIRVASTFYGSGKSRGWLAIVPRSATFSEAPVQRSAFIAENNQDVEISTLINRAGSNLVVGSLFTSSSKDLYCAGVSL